MCGFDEPSRLRSWLGNAPIHPYSTDSNKIQGDARRRKGTRISTHGQTAGPREAAATLLRDRSHATVLSAMWPYQPDALLAALLAEARNRSIHLRVIVADLAGQFSFLDEASMGSLRDGELDLVASAGSVPKSIASLVDQFCASLWEFDRLLADGSIPIDVFVARVVPSASAGSVALGSMIAFTPTALRCATATGFELVQGQEFGGTEPVSIQAPDVIYHARPDTVLPRLPEAQGSADIDQIGRTIAGLIPRHATLEVGLGSAPSSVFAHLPLRHDFGLHSGIIPASALPRLQDGSITGHHKSVDRGQHVATGIMMEGAAEWPDGVTLRPLASTHDPRRLRSQERFWAINSALEVDTSGAVNAEWVSGLRRFRTGGFNDFARAGHLSEGGASVIALPSRTRRGRSRIVPRFEGSAAVASPGTDIDFIVTEHGVADLRGRTLSERQQLIIGVAHPADRRRLGEELR